jgi:uncharacterized membrane protein YqgA involved in biofilm formation
VLARLPFRGTILNTLTVVVGALLGLAIGNVIPERLQAVALSGIGLICLGLGAKLVMESKNLLITTVAVVGGGVLGALIGIDVGIDQFAESVRSWLGGGDTFNEGLVSASVLFCVGPMTLLGCLKDGLERDIHLLAIKSVFDMIAAVFLAAALGPGVLVAAGVLFVVQCALTALARPLKPLAQDPRLVAEASAAGGAIMLAIGVKLLGLRDDLRAEVFLLALFIAPLVAPLFLRKEATTTVS